MDFIALSLAKKYVDDTANGLGAVKGSSATIESITPVEGGNNVTFAWIGADGKKQTQTMFVANGKDGDKGEDGVSPTVTVETIDGGHRVTITNKDDTKTFDVEDGKTPTIKLKTVNGQSLFGEGNIELNGGSTSGTGGNIPAGNLVLKTINGQSLFGEGDIEVVADIAPTLKTVSGKSLTISDARAESPDCFELYGFTRVFGKSKNLFDLERASNFSNYTVANLGGTNRRVLQFNLEPDTYYTYSRTKVDGLSSYQNISLYNTAGEGKSTLNSGVVSIRTGSDGLLYIGCTATAFTSSDQLKYVGQYENIQLEKGTVATPYEPYNDEQGVINSGTLNTETGKYDITINLTNGIESNEIVLSLTKPLSKWDYLTKKDNTWGISYNSEIIESYNGETIPSEFESSTGELTEGASLQYKTENEVFFELDDEVQSALNGLTLYTLSTKITNDSDVVFYVTYKVDSDAKIISSGIYVNVKDYGAVGDGETDDTAAIRTARDVARLTKKALYFPAGTYMLSGSIQIYSDMHIIGEKGATLKKYSAVVQNLTKAGEIGDTIVYVSDASQYKVGQDIYVGLNGSGNYADTVGYITSIDTETNGITFEVYPRHSADKNAGLARAVSTSGLVSTSFSMICTYRQEDAGSNIRIEGLTFDGNKLASGEPNAYQLSPIHIDPNMMDVTVRDCRVYKSNADGISLQNGGQSTVDNCIIDTTGYHGIHPGFTIKGVAISNCYIYNCPNSGVYDCYDVDSLEISNCYFVNCLYGIGGLDVESNGSNIVACTFVDCNEGVYLRATNGGASVAACSFQSCNIGVSGYVSGTATVTGCMFKNCNKAALFRNAWDMVFTGNVVKECTLPVSCEIYENNGQVKYNSNLVITNNIVTSSKSGKTSAFSISYANIAIIRNNLLTGNNATITVDKGTTSEIVTDGNIGTVTETDSTAG